MNTRTKVMSFETTREWLAGARAQSRRVVCTNGCFDILHSGHVAYLEGARSLGDVLLVGMNSDSSVRGLKGPGRPVNGEQDRARVLAALECVDGVCIFTGKRADRFLELVSPDIYVKGGDYTLETLDPGERSVLESCGAEIRFIDMVPGKSTTLILQKRDAPEESSSCGSSREGAPPDAGPLLAGSGGFRQTTP